MNIFKYILIVIGFGILSISNIGAQDLTKFGSLDAGQTKSVKVSLDKGKSVVSVYTMGESLLSCKFIDSSGNVGLEQKKVKRCRGESALNAPADITVQITNEDSKPIEYRLHLQSN